MEYPLQLFKYTYKTLTEHPLTIFKITKTLRTSFKSILNCQHFKVFYIIKTLTKHPLTVKKKL